MPEEILETPQQDRPLDDTDWTKIILAAVVGLGLLAASAYAGYYYGIQQVQQPEKPTPVASQPATKPTPIVEDETKDWKSYKNATVGYEIRYPQNWSYEVSGTSVYLFPVELPKVVGPGGEMVLDISTLIAEYAFVTVTTVGEKDKTLTEVAKIYRAAPQDEISVGGARGVKTTKRNPAQTGGAFPNATITSVFFKDLVGETFMIQVEAVDIENYSGVFDQILSTFKFLD